MSNKTATGFTKAPPSARLCPALCSRTEHHAAFGRSAWLEARCERRDEASCTDDQVEDERGRVVPEPDNERQHDQRDGDRDVRIAVQEWRNDADDSGRPGRAHGEHRGADAEGDGDPRGGGVLEAVDDRRDYSPAHEVVEPRHCGPPVLNDVAWYAPVATDPT